MLSQAASNPNVLIMETQILSWEAHVVRRVVGYVSQSEGYHAVGSGTGYTTICVNGEHHIPREDCSCIKKSICKILQAS